MEIILTQKSLVANSMIYLAWVSDLIIIIFWEMYQTISNNFIIVNNVIACRHHEINGLFLRLRNFEK